MADRTTPRSARSATKGSGARGTQRRDPAIDDPAPRRRLHLPTPGRSDAFGRGAESFARFMGTPAFLVGMTIFCAAWLLWNTLMPESAQFDPKALNFTLLTLILSLQASYAAPLLLLADNRQADRDRVQAEQDRQSNERSHATTDFITREIASLRLALSEMATRDFVRGEIRDLLEELHEPEATETDTAASAHGSHRAASPAGPASASDSAVRDLATPGGVDEEHLRALLREEIGRALSEHTAR